MLSFLKNWLKKDSSAEEKEEIKEESVLPVSDGPSTTVEQASAQGQSANKELHDTGLSLHESWEERLDSSQRYALSFLLSDLPPIETGNVSLAGIKIFPHEDGVEITAFIRNGLPRPIRFETMNLLILIKENELFARQSFDLSEVGEIPAFSARPWSFVFKKENFLQKDVMLASWKLAFELAQKKLVLPQQLELEESWIKALSDQQKQSLITLAQELPPLQPGEVNVQSVQLSKSEDQSIRCLLLIRNGSDQSLSFENFPLILLDAQDEKVAEGLFELDGLTVSAGASKPWLFTFPQERIVKENPDFTRWKVIVPQI
ncbi:accessory Sec system S-layer assembly protein [Brevibacillus sp. SYSU BS000544]|uniref:accessory Sec system S-layer assembly protein n=1 Tax=Brevibacillus sp. SYSU BS000544 TaxID=3416443 RepID=UPI003CE50493